MKKMAQRAEKEETEFKVPETLNHCVNNCGVAGNPSTNNMCQKCFNATSATTTTATTTTSSSAMSSMSSAANLKFSGEKSPRSSVFGFEAPLPAEISRKTTASLAEIARSDESASRRVVSRCSGCRRKVGLTGFRCRCGDLFCSEHRYSDRHVCSYDYKAAGREAIARENPVVKAAKIVRV